MRRRLFLLVWTSSLFLLLAGACGEDSSEGGDSLTDPVYVSSTAAHDWTVEEVVYGRGLTHQGAFEAETAAPMDLVADLYVPQAIDGLRPALLIVHGGGFLQGTRTQDDLVTFAEYFARRGWVVLSIDYRLVRHHGTCPQAWINMAEQRAGGLASNIVKATYPAVRDAKAASRWLQAHADEYGISPEHIAVLGASAGAQIGVAMGVTDPRDNAITPHMDRLARTGGRRGRTRPGRRAGRPGAARRPRGPGFQPRGSRGSPR